MSLSSAESGRKNDVSDRWQAAEIAGAGAGEFPGIKKIYKKSAINNLFFSIDPIRATRACQLFSSFFRIQRQASLLPHYKYIMKAVKIK